jgi:excisionase family DNA binding protein
MIIPGFYIPSLRSGSPLNAKGKRRPASFCGFDGFGKAPMKAYENTTTIRAGEDRLLTIGEVAKLTGLKVGSLYHLVSQRRIPFVRISARCIRFRLSAILRWWDELTEQPNPKKAKEVSLWPEESSIRNENAS